MVIVVLVMFDKTYNPKLKIYDQPDVMLFVFQIQRFSLPFITRVKYIIFKKQSHRRILIDFKFKLASNVFSR